MLKHWGIIACLSLVSFYGCAFQKAEFLSPDHTVPEAKLQPAEALELAESHLEKHGTVVWRDAENLRTHLVKRGRFYYIKRSDYPAKAASWYLRSCIKVNSRNGKMSYVR